MLNLNRDPDPFREEPAQELELGGKPRIAPEEPMVELLAEGATSIRPVKGTYDFPVDSLSLGESPSGQNPENYLDFSLDDFPLPSPTEPVFSEILPEDIPDFSPPSEETVEQPPAPEQKPQKGGLLAKLKAIFGYRLTIARVKKQPGEKKTGDDPQPDRAAPAAKVKKVKAPKAAKKPKEKKPKPAAKAVRAKKAPKPAAGKEKKGVSKKMVALLVAGLVVLAGGGTGAFLWVRAANQPEKLLEKAQQYAAGEQYDKAVSVYEKVIQAEELLPEAYLGMAQSLVDSGDLEGAVSRLTLGYQTTQDERLASRLEELSPKEADGEEGVPALSTEPIQWKDSAFESMVRLALEKPQGSISEADLAGITSLKILGNGHASVKGDLYAKNEVDGYTIGGETFTERGGITTLDDVVYFKDLTRLTVGYNQVRDISALEDMSLSTISLYANDITDLSPLGKIKGLRFLYLYNNHVSDISALATQSELICLALQYNQISDLTPLAGLSNLQELYIGNNLVEDISPLTKLPQLSFLDARGNHISNIAPVASMPGLTDACFLNNPVTDYTPAVHVQNLNQSFQKAQV